MYLGTINNYFLWNEVEIPSMDKQATVPSCMTFLNKGFPANIRKKSYAFQGQAAGKREEINTEETVDHPGRSYSSVPRLKALSFILLTSLLPFKSWGCSLQGLCRTAPGNLSAKVWNHSWLWLDGLREISAWLTFSCYWFASVPAGELIRRFKQILDLNGYQIHWAHPDHQDLAIPFLTFKLYKWIHSSLPSGQSNPTSLFFSCGLHFIMPPSLRKYRFFKVKCRS